jgi:hypothetical protein
MNDIAPLQAPGATKKESEGKDLVNEIMEGILGGAGAIAAGPVGLGIAKGQGAELENKELSPQRKKDLEDIKFP